MLRNQTVLKKNNQDLLKEIDTNTNLNNYLIEDIYKKLYDCTNIVHLKKIK